MLHYLRIAVTALSLTACVLLVVLWVRSYWWVEQVFVQIPATTICVGSMPGVFVFWCSDNPLNATLAKVRLEKVSMPTSDWVVHTSKATGTSWSGAMKFGVLGNGFTMPYWFGVLESVVFGTAPWLRSRFSLRTLLIATTLVAVVLGIVVASS